MAVFLTVAFAVTFAFHGQILDWLNRPLPDDLQKPVTFSPIEPFTTSVWLSLYAALLIAIAWGRGDDPLS